MATLSLDKGTITTRERPVLVIGVDPSMGPFTWAITDGHGRTCQSRVVSRSKGQPGTYRIPARPLGSIGAYHVHLYQGSVAAKQIPGTALAESVGLAVVGDSPVVEGLPDPIRVSLTADGEPSRVDPSRFVDFTEFRKSRGGRGRQASFGSTDSYEDLLDQALEYVRGHRIKDFGDLMPRGYLKERVNDSTFPQLAKRGAAELPAVELIWNYWQEEGMLVQTLSVILARFQNRRLPGRDPLVRFDVTPLLSLRNLLWGYAEGEMRRTTLRRRAAEYEYEYGLSLIGRAVPPPSVNVERRSAFLDAFHRVLHTAHVFYKEVDDLTVNADAFPLSQALRDCHVVLSQGSQNQYGEMAVTARAEFLVMQSMLAEKEMREFLGGRPMTPYPEPWMDRVDSMKSIQGWDDTSVMHYHDLATLGEQLVLTIRLGNWAATAVGPTEARSWGQAFRESVQRYTSAYRSVTGVDLTRQATAELPSRLIARKVAAQRRGA